MATQYQEARRLVGVLVTLAFAPAVRAELPEHVAIHRGATPSWVEVVDLGPLVGGNLTEGVPDRMVLHDTQILVPPTGPAQWYEQLLYRFDNETAVEDLSTISLDFDASYQELLVHAVRVRREGEWSDRIERSRASAVQVEDRLEQKIYARIESLVLIVDDLRVGDLLSVEYTLVGSNPVLADGWAASVWLGGEAVSRRSVRVLADRPLDYALHGDAPAPARDTAEGGRREIAWRLEPQPAPEAWYSVPWAFSPQPWIQLSTFLNWSEVATWAQPLFAVPPSSAEIDEIASSLGAGGTDELLIAARDWVQRSIRYFAVPIGPHSHRPYTPSEILERRYGDCKDKTMVLLALLHEVEIEAWPVLVNTGWRGGLASFLPSPFAFDHVIVAARVEGRVVWLDPTLTHQGGNGLAGITVPHYRMGLEVAPGTSTLSEMPETQRGGSLKEVFYHYKVQEGLKRYEVDVKTVLYGAEAESTRRNLDGVSKEELQERYLEYYEADHLALTSRGPVEVSDDRQGNVLEISERYAVSADGVDEEWPFSTLELELGGELPLADDERNVPLGLPFPLKRREWIRIDAPKAWDFTPLNEAVANDWLRFAVRSTIERNGRSITLEYRLDTIADAVAVSDLTDYNRDVETLNENLGYALGEPQGLGELSLFGLDVWAVLWAVGLGSFAALGVLALLLASRVGDKRLVAFWLPSGGPQPALSEPPGNEAVRYRDPSRPTLAAAAFVLVASLVSVLEVPAGLLPGSLSHKLYAIEVLYYVALFLSFGIAALFVIMAQRRLLRNLEAFGLIKLNPSIKWSTWSWFVPIAFLFVPYRSFRQVGVGSSSPADRRAVLRLVGCWWGPWIFSNLTGTWTGLVGSETVSSEVGLRVLQTFTLLASITECLAGLLLVTLLLVLRSLQREAARLAVQADAVGRSQATSPEELAERLHAALPTPAALFPPAAPPPFFVGA